MIQCAVISLLLCIVLMTYTNLGAVTVALIFFALGFITSSQIISYPVIFESNHKSITGSCESLASFIILGGGAIFQWLYGVFLDINWQGKISEGVRIYSTQEHSSAFYMIPITLVISIAIAFMIKETHCKPYSKEQ